MRIHEFAKKISKDSKEVIAILAANGIEGKKTMSSISEDEMNLVLEKSHTEKGGNKPEKKQEKEESPKNRRNHNRKKEGNKTAEK
ncbi:MAG: translation initiation factor IF-2 N-terminal domain-containing protein, partial [Lachnospiraceae bacterium]